MLYTKDGRRILLQSFNLKKEQKETERPLAYSSSLAGLFRRLFQDKFEVRPEQRR